MIVKLCLDPESITNKDYAKKHIVDINKRIAQYEVSETLEKISEEVGVKGKTFTSAQFTEAIRSSSHFKSMQLFALDFDDGTPYKKMESKAKEYGLPIAFAYKSLSYSEEFEKYRIVFCLDAIISYENIAKLIFHILLKLFPEADKACKDVSRIYFGGKGLLNTEYGILSLKKCIDMFQTQKYIKDVSRHLKRDMHSLAEKYQVGLKNGYIDLEEINSIDRKNGAKMENAYYIYKADDKIAPNFYKLEKYSKLEIEKIKPKTVKEKSDFHRYHRNVLEKALSVCELLRTMKTDSDLIGHNEKFGLLSNLSHIDCREKYFLSLLPKQDVSKWKYQAAYIKSRDDYNPMLCDSYCPFKEECSHEHTLLKTIDRKNRIEKLYEDNYCSLEEAESDFQRNFTEVMKLNDNNLHVIQAQTAIGKTECYCRYIKERCENEKFYIAVPTLKLKKEVYQRLRKMGVPAVMPVSLLELDNISIQTLEHLQGLCNCGYYQDARNELKRYIKNSGGYTKNELKSMKKKIYEYMYFVNVLKQGKVQVVVSTHAQLLHLPQDVLELYQIIIDEDILYSICNSGKIIKEKDIHTLLDGYGLNRKQREMLNTLISLPAGQPSTWNHRSVYISLKIAESNNIYSNFNDLKNGCIIWRERGKEACSDIFHYYYPYKLYNKKFVILTATGNQYVYRNYFAERNVDYRICKKAGITGKIIQFSYYSCSRTKLDGLKYEKVKKEIKKITGDIPTITFKEFGEDMLYFGNTEGVDNYAEYNIAVIGTPHVNEIAYYMLAYAIDHNVAVSKLSFRKVQFTNYRFLLMSYKNVLLQEIQKYYISTALEQAVGRARVLRKDNTVYIFSDFPVEQAELCNEKYLRELELQTEKNIKSKYHQTFRVWWYFSGFIGGKIIHFFISVLFLPMFFRTIF